LACGRYLYNPHADAIYIFSEKCKGMVKIADCVSLSAEPRER